MATAQEQLMGMLNPQTARLLDNQMRQKQVAQRSQGAGMLSGLTQAYTGMADAVTGAAGFTPMGANEQQAIQANLKTEQNKTLQASITSEVGKAIKSSDLKELAISRDNLLATGTQAATSAAQKVQDKIDRLTKKQEDTGKLDNKTSAALDIVNKSKLSEEQKQQINNEVTTGITKAENINERIKNAEESTAKDNALASGIAALSHYDLSEDEIKAYTGALKSGASFTTILQKVIPTKERLTVERLSQMHRFFTPTSVDAFKEAFSKGKRGVALPALVEQDSERKVNVSSISKSMLINFDALVNENFDEYPDVKAVFTSAGWGGNSVDTNKIKAYVADVYTYANKNNLLPREALIEWATEQNQSANKPVEVTVTPEQLKIAIKNNPDVSVDVLRKAISDKFNSKK